jgi:putative copper resistance protein D
LDDPLIWVRALHFAATMMVSGGVLFLIFIAEPAFRAAGDTQVAACVRPSIAWMARATLAVSVLSGAAWLILLAQRMSEQSMAEVLSQGTLWTVMTETDFGLAWTIRLAIAALLAVALPLSARLRGVAITSAAALVGSLAWAGHAAAREGAPGAIHLISDILHLVAAAAWFGALIPLALLLLAARRVATGLPVAREAVRRFSPLGILSVGTLVASGAINTWMLTGSVEALIGTDYGRLLILKVGLFLVMLSFGAINRVWLSPRTAGAPPAGAGALRWIERNSLIEALLGAIIIVIVGLLGTLPPGLEDNN